MGKYEWPEDAILRRGVEAKGVEWVAKELGVSSASLRRHLIARSLPTRTTARKLKPSEALKKVAALAD